MSSLRLAAVAVLLVPALGCSAEAPRPAKRAPARETSLPRTRDPAPPPARSEPAQPTVEEVLLLPRSRPPRPDPPGLEREETPHVEPRVEPGRPEERPSPSERPSPTADSEPGDLDRASSEHQSVLERERRLHPALGAIAWRYERTAHFLFFREADTATDEPLVWFEVARAEALARLGLTESAVPASALVPVFVLEGSHRFQESGVSDVAWADGCAAFSPVEGGFERAIYVTNRGAGTLPRVVQHEVAHVFAAEAFGQEGVPTWAVEGVACYAEGDAARACYVNAVLREPAIAIAEIAATSYADLTSTDAYFFYARAYLVFDALVRRTGSVKEAVDASRLMRSLGSNLGLARVGVMMNDFEQQLSRENRERRRVREASEPPTPASSVATDDLPVRSFVGRAVVLSTLFLALGVARALSRAPVRG
jgi:hypothetical protein